MKIVLPHLNNILEIRFRQSMPAKFHPDPI